MNILIDADGCPVVDLTLQIARAVRCSGHHSVRHSSHQIEREGAQTLVFDKGADSVDFALVNRVKPSDHCHNTGLWAGKYVPCPVCQSAEPERLGVHRRQHGRPHAAAVRKQKAPSCREAPQGEPKADKGAG